jgi:hypothetical protein
MSDGIEDENDLEDPLSESEGDDEEGDFKGGSVTISEYGEISLNNEGFFKVLDERGQTLIEIVVNPYEAGKLSDLLNAFLNDEKYKE